LALDAQIDAPVVVKVCGGIVGQDRDEPLGLRASSW
jgi:hypothetical protein